jgi:ABC-type bacteriocin/lantibiotic exporter with double-glycine peptidase domain
MLSGYQAKLVKADQDLAVKTLWLTSAPPFLTAFAQIAVLALGGLRVMQGELTMGMLVAFQSLMSSVIAPANALVDLGSSLQEIEGNMSRLDDVLRHPIDPRLAAATTGTERAPSGNGGPGAGQSTVVADRLTGRIELKNVTFGYSRLAPPLIRDFSLVVEPGQRVALVGRSGSGKSTISKLVCQLYEPWEGEILLDGQPARQHPPDVLAASIAFVDQDLFLFEGTLRENLTLWDETIPEPAILQAARDAEIHDDVVARPGGFDAPVGEGGANFSGGQRQRLDIARALAGDPRILVLDEATSALDPVTEQSIDENLRSRGCTCVIVAHRLSTIRDADEIIVLDQGEVVQRGTHDSLMRDPEGAYAHLVEG